MENSRETKKNNGPLPEFHELFCHEYQKEKHIHYHQNGHFGSQEASFVSGNDRKRSFYPDFTRIYPGFTLESKPIRITLKFGRRKIPVQLQNLKKRKKMIKIKLLLVPKLLPHQCNSRCNSQCNTLLSQKSKFDKLNRKSNQQIRQFR